MKFNPLSEEEVQAPSSTYCRYLRVQFRSILEAQWACYFHIAGIPWRYEPDFIEYDFERWYVPDFKVRLSPRRWHYVEVKPTLKAMHCNRHKIRACARRGKPAICLVGAPGANRPYVYWHLQDLPLLEGHLPGIDQLNVSREAALLVRRRMSP